jgi:CubicO group peptidase (beta-lactamase class C family)
MSIAIVENGNVSTFVFGIKNKNHDKVTKNTLFKAGSLSKPVFAITVMRLVEKGCLDLDADIANYLNEQIYTTFDGKAHKITLRQILSHRAGFSVHGFPGYKKGTKIPTLYEMIKGVSNQGFVNAKYTKPIKIIKIEDENLKKLADSMGMTLAGDTPLHLERLPDSEYTYSGGGYVLGQFIIEHVIKKPFTQIAFDEVFKPLSMRITNFEQPLKNEELRDYSCGFYHDTTLLANGYDIDPELAAGGLWTTPSEYLRLCIEISKAYNCQSDFLQKQTVETMLIKTDERVPMGLGITVGDSKKGIVFGHNGGTNGYSSSMSFCVNNGSGIVIMQNSNVDCRNEITKSFREVFEW